MITLSNGHAFEYRTASGAMGYEGKGWLHERPLVLAGFIQPKLFTHVIKTLTYDPTKGNLDWTAPWRCIKLLWENDSILGTLNAVALTNPGFWWWYDNIGCRVRRGDVALMVSINQDNNLSRIREVVRALNHLDIVGVELNTFCPNIKHGQTPEEIEYEESRTIETCAEIKTYSRHPVIAKLTCVQRLSLAFRLEHYAEAIAINSVPWTHSGRNLEDSPLYHLNKTNGGGVSGKLAQPQNWKFLSELAGSLKIPVIGPSIWDFEDMDEVRRRGAKAIDFGAVHIPYPWRPTQFVRKDLRRARTRKPEAISHQPCAVVGSR